MRRSAGVALASLIAAVSAGGRPRAATCPAPAGAPATLAAVDGRERLFWISRQLEVDARRGRVWAMGWGVGIGAAGAASLMAVPFVAPSTRVDWYTSAATAAVGVVPFLVSPLSVTRDAPKLRGLLDAAPPEDDAQTCALLARAEHMLRDDAANERLQRRWFIHAGNLAFNAGVFLFLGLGFHHWSAGAVNGLAGAAVGEAIIFTQPTGVIDAERAYWGWGYAASF
ncbi:MAG TPA: hypothetical protein VHL80_13570 [Polyangia bacterium]|nr:hypothetical protein [Polyangia bacterium]